MLTPQKRWIFNSELSFRNVELSLFQLHRLFSPWNRSKTILLFNRLAGKKKIGPQLSHLVWAESEGRQRKV